MTEQQLKALLQYIDTRIVEKIASTNLGDSLYESIALSEHRRELELAFDLPPYELA